MLREIFAGGFRPHLFSLLLKRKSSALRENFKRKEEILSFFRIYRASRLTRDNIRCQCKHEGVENSQVKFLTSQRQEQKHFLLSTPSRRKTSGKTEEKHP